MGGQHLPHSQHRQAAGLCAVALASIEADAESADVLQRLAAES